MLKYLVEPIFSNEQIEILTRLSIMYNVYDLIKNTLQNYTKKKVSSLLDHLDLLLQKNKQNEITYTNLTKLWHSIYDLLASKHSKQLFGINLPLIEQITNEFKQKSDKKDVIITMTTCKRMDLTYRTINSMIRCISDLTERVSEFVVIDDNSSEDDRKQLIDTYPFITLIKKTPSEKGHPKSMNMLLPIIQKYKYQFHIEDDWEFFHEDKYIQRCINIIELNPEYGQCLLNRDYGEDQQTINNIGGSLYKQSEFGSYFEHRFLQGKQLEDEVKKLQIANNLYWPHFSFRVGITKTSVYDKVGPFNEQAQHFEMEYGHRYVQAGYKTVFLDKLYCTHTGRRTYERDDKTKKNAYDLNNEQQFGEKPKSDDSQNQKENNSGILQISVYVVNLKRRKDRLIKFFKHNLNECKTFKIYDAIDGTKINPTSKSQRLFQTGDFNYRRGIMGVASSMIDIWKKFITDASSNYAIIFEDDVVLTPNFYNKICKLISDNQNKFDIIYGHMNPYPHSNKEEFYKRDIQPTLVQYNTQRMMNENMGSMAATILTKQGAKILLEDINKKGVYNAIDWVAMKTCDLQRAFVTVPFIAFADCYQSNNTKDTDIQTDYNICSFTNWSKEEIIYWQNILKGTKKNTNIRLVSFQDKSTLIQTVESLGFKVQTIRKDELKQNDILLQDIETIKSKVSNVTICPLNSTIKTSSSNYYKTDKLTIVIPHLLLNDNLIKEKTWGDGYLNLLCPL